MDIVIFIFISRHKYLFIYCEVENSSEVLRIIENICLFSADIVEDQLLYYTQSLYN